MRNHQNYTTHIIWLVPRGYHRLIEERDASQTQKTWKKKERTLAHPRVKPA